MAVSVTTQNGKHDMNNRIRYLVYSPGMDCLGTKVIYYDRSRASRKASELGGDFTVVRLQLENCTPQRMLPPQPEVRCTPDPT